MKNTTRIAIMDKLVKMARSTEDDSAPEEIEKLAKRLGLSVSEVCISFATSYAKGDVDRYIAALEGC